MFGASLLAGPCLSARTLPQEPPDLTAGGSIPKNHKHDWTLGATGARGWIHCHKMVTSTARQIAITEVTKGSPASKVLEVGDVLLGVGGEEFSYDPRTEFGRALTLAESKKGKGQLKLKRWRDGKTRTVTLKLPVIGAYSDTAPFDCSKSERILEQGCAMLAERLEEPRYKPNPIPRAMNALALLASGEKRYLPLVRREAKWATGFSTESFRTWYYGYLTILVAEYVIATGDKSMLPALRRMALEAASGQSIVGSWGHDYARPDGLLYGYGMMNSPGLPLTIGMVLARAAGVKEKAVDEAIEKSVYLLRFYVGKGAVPYGDHHPWIQTHEDNGKCGMAAVLFDLLGDTEAATYFSRMSVASHGAERDTGHTGNFFNVFWAMPAIALSGEHASGAWMQEFGAWYFDFAREWKGTFRHQGPPEPKKDKYGGWDATGLFLLAYAQPLEEIALTGKRVKGLGAQVPEVSKKEAVELIVDGRGWSNLYRTAFSDGLSEQDLLDRVSSWSPIVRERAGQALVRRKAEVVDTLVSMLDSPKLESRIGACQALGFYKGRAEAAVPKLIEQLDSEDLWLRVKAAEALSQIGKSAVAALPMLLDALARKPDEDDPRGMEQRYLCFALFDRRNGMLKRSIEGVDREALHTAIRAGLRNQDGRARSAVGNVYGRLSLEEIRPLLPEIHAAILESAPSGIMFADGVRTSGLNLLAKHRVSEGVEACSFYVRNMKQHGSEKRVPKILDILKSYGAHAQRVIPELEGIADYFENDEVRFPKKLSKRKAQAVRDAIQEIRGLTERPELISIR